MTYDVIIKKEALTDTQEAYDYYEQIKEGLGDRFLDKLEASYQSLSSYPTNFGFIDNNQVLRDKLIAVFPYTIIYKIEGENVIVVAVHNCHQHPDKRYR